MRCLYGYLLHTHFHLKNRILRLAALVSCCNIGSHIIFFALMSCVLFCEKMSKHNLHNLESLLGPPSSFQDCTLRDLNVVFI